ncbi:MAG TPA: helical backbone metal receptor [Terriglobales bacterium]|nr:helical backbone metal receptor [Terriglobales bacterium]
MKRLCVLAAMVLCLGPVSWAARTVKDETGRTVTVPDKVNRVVSLTPSVTDTIYALGGGPQLVAITDFTEYPPQAAREKPSIGDILHPSLERILSFHPDVVIAVSTLNSPETVRGLERMKIPVFLVHGRGLAGVYSAIASIGQVIGREREAAELTRKLKEREQRVRKLSEGKKKPSVFLSVQLEPCITAGSGAFITELIEAAGARSVTSDVKQDWLRISLESVIPRNPDYILIMKSAPFGLKEMRARAGWNALRAVREGHVMYADDRLQIPGPVAFDGLEDLAKNIEAAR